MSINYCVIVFCLNLMYSFPCTLYEIFQTFHVQEMQKERELNLIVNLKGYLQPFVEGQTDEFISWANSEALRLSRVGKT